MRSALTVILQWTTLAAMLLLAVGLVQPWWVLWWRPVQNRLRVIKFYGGIGVAAWLLSKLLLLTSS